MNPSPMSKIGGFYHSANKGRIYNVGQRELQAVTESGAPISITFQVADIQTPLGSVKRLCQAGNRVVFEGENDGAYIEHIESGQRIPIYLEDGQYMIHLWSRKDGNKPSNEMTVGGRFAALMQEEDQACEEQGEPQEGDSQEEEDVPPIPKEAAKRRPKEATPKSKLSIGESFQRTMCELGCNCNSGFHRQVP